MERTPLRPALTRGQRERRHRSQRRNRQRRRGSRALQRRRLSSQWNRLSRIEPRVYPPRGGEDTGLQYFAEVWNAWEQGLDAPDQIHLAQAPDQAELIADPVADQADYICIVCYNGANDIDGPLIDACNCHNELSRFHYTCLCDHIELSADRPCLQCETQYSDPRIDRYFEQRYSASASNEPPHPAVDFRDYYGPGQTRFMNVPLQQLLVKEEEDRYKEERLMEAIAIMDQEHAEQMKLQKQQQYAVVYEDETDAPPDFSNMPGFSIPDPGSDDDDDAPPSFQF